MKRTLLLILSIFFFINVVYAQNNISINLNDKVYDILRSAELQNLCSRLSSIKPYSKGYITAKLEEILSNLEVNEDDAQIKIIKDYLKKYKYEDGLNLSSGYIKFDNKNTSIPTSLIIYNAIHANLGTGIYEDTSQNSTGFEGNYNIGFMGDFGERISYNCTGFVGVTKMPLEKVGDDYSIGVWLYNDRTSQTPRTINVYKNNSYLPYKYSKFWDGSCYFFSNMSSGGLEGWPLSTALAFGMTGEIHASLYNNVIELGIGRFKREWGAMDTDSSLILNSHARPFLATEAVFSPFDFLSLSCLTGILEMPKQDYINKDAWYMINENGQLTDHCEDGYFFQNAFSMIMVTLDLPHFHFDFGSTAVWPKRFELGYPFPLIDNVIYQNNIGDNDNLGLFGNLKFNVPSIGSIWFSGFLDEISADIIKFWRKTRAMFAFQAGGKINLPWVPFTTVSFRYTKVEPYCYTHHSINYAPWYSHYISESYTNNGECLGYYLAPNSDEFNLQIESNPTSFLNLGFQYQLIRHGVDWGSGAVPGSNLYSELRNNDRSELEKFFLHDGTYEWSNIFSISCNYNLRQFNIPATVFVGIGYIYDWFTQIEGEPGVNTKYSYVNNDEYSEKNGIVLNIGASFFFD